MIWFSSDLHFNHDKDFIYKPRGFDDIDEMNSTILQNFHKTILPNDDLYLLGDTMLGNLEEGIKLFHQLPGKIHLIWGNHCTENRKKAMVESYNVVEVLGLAHILKYNNLNFYLCHYPTCTANFELDKPLKSRLLSISGHTHSKDKFEPCGSYNVAVDAHNNYPISIDTIISAFKERNKT